jgi:hypothetical protein
MVDPYSFEGAIGHVERVEGNGLTGRCYECRMKANELYTPEEAMRWQDAKVGFTPKENKMTLEECNKRVGNIICLR